MNQVAPETSAERRPKVGVVLGSGGIKAFAGVALFEFLDRSDIVVDLLVGCSGGALVCAALAAGYTPSEGRRLIREALDREPFARVDYRTILGMASPRLGRFDLSSGILKPDRLREIYREIFHDLRVEDLRPRTILQATDLQTGEGVVITKGPAADAVYASGAFFPALPPVYFEGRWLADGVYSSPVPVMEAVKRNMDVIIALDFKERVTGEPQGFLNCFNRYIDSTMRSLTRSQMFLSVDLHHHEIVVVEVRFDKQINIRDARELPTIYAAGERAIEENQAAILSAIRSFSRAGRDGR